LIGPSGDRGNQSQKNAIIRLKDKLLNLKRTSRLTW
jgi:hypothetical protein